MHERTQRAVARLMFVFCCAVPTFLVLLIIVITWTPWFENRKLAEIRGRLARETGLAIQIDSCDLIGPGSYLLENVQLSHPETHATVATVRSIVYYQGPDRIALNLHQPELHSAGLGSVWAMLHDRLISRPEHTVLPITIAALDLNIHSQTGSVLLSNLNATITPELTGIRLTASSGKPHNTSPHTALHNSPRLKLDLFRDRSSQDKDGPAPATVLTVSTEGTALPCSALAEYLPIAKRLGSDAMFSGNFKGTQHRNGWAYDFSGSSITQIALEELTLSLPYRLIGPANLSLRRCQIQPGQSVNIVGDFLATPNIRIETELLKMMRDRFAMKIDEQAIGGRDGLHCSLAAINFEITDERVQLTGTCGQSEPGLPQGIALYARGAPIAWTSDQPFEAQAITATFDPPTPSLATWNQVFLPTSPHHWNREPGQGTPIAREPRAGIRGVGPWENGPLTKQR